MTGTSWRLPDDADVADLAQKIADLLAPGATASLVVPVEAGNPDEPRGGMLFLNGSQIHSIWLVTLPD